MSNLIFKKDGLELNVKTIADSVKYNQDTTVKQALDSILQRLNNIGSGDGLPNTGTSTPTIDTTHNTLSINSEQGVHNLRYYNDKLSINIDGEWIDLELGGTKVEGIKLPPTKFITIHSREVNTTNVTITWEDSGDQTLNGAVISKWAGTKLIRKLDSPPANEHDGELLLDNKEFNKYKLNGFVDSNIQLNKVYYYALFPYAEDGTHNYDITNIRKFYKTEGAVPGNTTGIQVIPIFNGIKLKFSDGVTTDTALWAGTRVVRKIGSPPTSETDGVIVLDNSSRDKYTSNGFVDDTATQKLDYYYGLFPYSSEGHFNLDPLNIVMGNPVTNKVYSLRIDMSNTNPSDACTYADSATDVSVGDGWDDIDIFSEIKPCLLKNGEVNYYLNPNDYTKKLDGSPSNLNGLDGDVMIEIPYIGVKYSTSGNTLTISLCKDYELSRSDLGYTSHAYIDKDGNVAKKIYVGAYQGYIDSNNMYSKTGVVPEKYTIKQIEDAIATRGEHYCPYTGAVNMLLSTLYTVKYKTRSPYDHLVNNNATFAGETGTLNKSGLWHKGDAGKLCGIEWMVINANLWLSSWRLKNKYYRNSYDSTYDSVSRSIEITRPTTEINITTITLSDYYPNNNAYNNNYYIDGYTHKMITRSTEVMMPDANQTSSSSTGWCNYTSGLSPHNDTSDYYGLISVHPTIASCYKHPLNFYFEINHKEYNKNNTSYTLFSTHLMYIKGEVA